MFLLFFVLRMTTKKRTYVWSFFSIHAVFMKEDDSTKEDTIGNSIEDMSAKSSSGESKNLQKSSLTYPVTEEDIMYSKVPGEHLDTRFICQPVTESTLEVKPRELSSVYGVECVQILDAIAFDDDDVE